MTPKRVGFFWRFLTPGLFFSVFFGSFVPKAPPCRQSAQKCQKFHQILDFSGIFRQIRQPLEKNLEAFLWHRLSRNSTEKACETPSKKNAIVPPLFFTCFRDSFRRQSAGSSCREKFILKNWRKWPPVFYVFQGQLPQAE